MTGVAAGEIARAGAAAGFEMASGLEVQAEIPALATTDAVADVNARLGADDPLLAKFLPRDVVELQNLVSRPLVVLCVLRSDERFPCHICAGFRGGLSQGGEELHVDRRPPSICRVCSVQTWLLKDCCMNAIR